jgi:uncharacterized protein
LILDLSTKEKKNITEKEAVSAYITQSKQLASLFPKVLFSLLIHSNLYPFDFQFFIQSMNEHFSESERKNISIFVHNKLSSFRQDDAQMREDMLHQLHQAGYNQQWEDLFPMICSEERRHAYTMNGEGSVGKCAVGFNQTAPGYLTTHGNVFWEETTIQMDNDIPLFENMRCLSCKHLPLCMGQCIPLQRVEGDNMIAASSDCLLPPWGISPETAIQNYCSAMMEHYVNGDESEL